MSDWFQGSKPKESGKRDVTIVFHNDDSVGTVKGQIVFFGESFDVTGNWAAAGSVPGRKFSAFTVSGSDGKPAPQYIVATGTMQGPGQKPDSLQMSITRTSTTTGQMRGWEDMLYPM